MSMRDREAEVPRAPTRRETRGNQPNQKIPQTNRILLAVAAARERRARAAEGPRRPRPRDAAVKAVLAELGRVQRLAISHTQPHKVRFDTYTLEHAHNNLPFGQGDAADVPPMS